MGENTNDTPKKRSLQRGFVILGLLLLLIPLVFVVSLDRRVTKQFEGRRWNLPARVYAQPIDLYVGQAFSADRFTAELTRLGYLPQAGTARPGSFRRKGERVDVYTRDFRFPDGPQAAQQLRLDFVEDAISSIKGTNGADVAVFRLDPLMIGSIVPIHGEDRIIVSPAEVPPLLPEALKAVEDQKFDKHHGIDPMAIMRALVTNVRAGQVEQGGSTLTQQLVKSFFLDSRRTLGRKVEEAIMSVLVEFHFDKPDIMNAYINEIYLGQDGQRAVHGFGLASQFYFGKQLAECNLHEIAMLVTIVRGPSYYDPRRHPERVLERRNLVLKLLADRGVIKPDEAERAAKKPLGIVDNTNRDANYFPAFLDLVRVQLHRDYKEDALKAEGLTIFTTLDPLAQQKAEQTLEEELHRQDTSWRKAAHGLEGAVVITTPQTAEVIAVVGGRRAAFDGFNRAVKMQRPIGSLAKPVVYLTALESGEYTPASLVNDRPIQLKLADGTLWKPANFDKRIYGRVTMVRALSQSLNLATINLGRSVGLSRVSHTFEQLGLDRRPPAYPSMLLGAVDMSPIEVAQIYNTIANGGFRSPLRTVRAVIDEQGKPLKAPELEVSEAVSPESVYVLQKMMIQVFERGTGKPARAELPEDLVVAGKTGTSNDYRDSWFSGYSGGHLIVVWMGHDDYSETGLTGGTGALPVWTKLMSTIGTTSFEPVLPDKLEDRWIDYYSGRETSNRCNGSAVSMGFLVSQILEPSPRCPPDLSHRDSSGSSGSGAATRPAPAAAAAAETITGEDPPEPATDQPETEPQTAPQP